MDIEKTKEHQKARLLSLIDQHVEHDIADKTPYYAIVRGAPVTTQQWSN